MTSKIEISPKTIIIILLIIASLWLIIQIRDILFLLFISFILMSALRPVINRLESLKIPRVLGILLVYFLVFGVFGLMLASIIPPLISQSTKLTQSLPEFFSRYLPYWDINIKSFTDQIAPLGANIVLFTVGIFSNIVTIFAVMVITFYLLLERSRLDNFLVEMLGEESGTRIVQIFKRVEKGLGSWLLGELALMLGIGVLTYIGLLLLKMEFALPLAIFAGLLEIIPTIGPVLSAIPAILVAFTISPLMALAVVALFIIVQQIENNLFVPMVMKKVVGLPPLITIISLMIGGRIAGLTGAILAVPIVVMLKVIASELLAKKD